MEKHNKIFSGSKPARAGNKLGEQMMIKLITVAMLALLCCGCSVFRDAFDESPKKHQEKMMRKEQAKRERDKHHRFQDPVHDMFKVRNDAPILPESNLSPYERLVIDAHRHTNIDDVEAIKLEGERARKARQEWVFGKNPFD